MSQAVILAGGKGTRLRPLTENIPKPMIDINGKPFLEYQILLLKKYGINDIILSVGYMKEKILGHFGDGSKLGVNITYSKEDKAMGTGGALKLAENKVDDEFFVVYGDSYLDLDYSDVMKFFKNKNKLALVVVYDNKENTDVKNNIVLDKEDNVAEYNKDSDKGNFVDAGVLILKKEVLKMIEKDKEISLEKEIFPKLIRDKELIAYKSDKRFYDMGTEERLGEVRLILR
jgi:NDP-sugar pyrophosphorylase family protein